MKFAERAAQLPAYAFVFLLPWQTRLILYQGNLNGGAWEYGTVSLYAVELFLWGALILVGIQQCKVKSVKCKVSVKSLKFWGGVAAVGVIVFSLIRSRAPGLGWYWILHAIEAVGIFWLVRQKFVRIKPLVIVLLCGAVLQSALAFWQFSSQEVFASKWLGMAAQDPAVSGVSVVENEQGRFLRAYGFLPHPNILGGYLAIALVIFLGIRCQVSGVRDEVSGMRLWNRFAWPGVLFVVLGLVLSFSRSAWLAFLGGSLMLLIYSYFRKNPVFLKSFFILHSTFFILVFAFWPLTQTRIFGEGRLERFSIEQRSGKMWEAVEIFRRHPWLGVGPGNYTLAVYRELDNTRPGTAYQPAHNVFLLAIAELGVVGIAALGFLVAFVAQWRNFFKKPEAIAIMVALLTLMFFDHFLWSLPFGLWLSGLALGFARRVETDIMNDTVKGGKG